MYYVVLCVELIIELL